MDYYRIIPADEYSFMKSRLLIYQQIISFIGILQVFDKIFQIVYNPKIL